MEQTVIVKGYFYLPNNPDDKLAGILTYSQEEGINLDLFGHFSHYSGPAKRESNIVLGFTSNGKKVTLLNCYEFSRGLHMPGIPESKISAIYLFIGEHFENAESIVFDHCILEYEDFNHWINVSGFSMPKHNQESGEITLKYKQPEEISFKLKQNWTASIKFNYAHPSEYSIPLNKVSIEQHPCLKFKPDTHSIFSDFQEIYYVFNSFLAVNYFVYPIIKSIHFYSPNKTHIEADNKHLQHNKVELFFKTGVNHHNYKSHHDRHDFLLQYKDFGTSFEQKIRNWYLLSEKVETSLNILTECFMARGNPTELHFISLVQALENFHRRIKLKKKIPLRSRLKNLADLLPKNVRTELLGDYNLFLDRVEINRNYYIHYSEDQEKKAGPLNELFDLSEKMKIFLIAIMLIEIGLTNEEIEKLILGKGTWLFNHIIKLGIIKT